MSRHTACLHCQVVATPEEVRTGAFAAQHVKCPTMAINSKKAVTFLQALMLSKAEAPAALGLGMPRPEELASALVAPAPAPIPATTSAPATSAPAAPPAHIPTREEMAETETAVAGIPLSSDTSSSSSDSSSDSDDDVDLDRTRKEFDVTLSEYEEVIVTPSAPVASSTPAEGLKQAEEARREREAEARKREEEARKREVEMVATTSGIRSQAQQWDRDQEKAAISQTFALQALNDRHNLLKRQCERVTEELEAERAKARTLSKVQQQLLDEQQDNCRLSKELKELRRRIEAEQARAERYAQRAQEATKKLEEKEKELRAREEKTAALERRFEPTQTALHLPCYRGRLVTEDMEAIVGMDTTHVCTRDPREGVHCHHLLLDSFGALKMVVKKERYKRSSALPPLKEPPSQRPRQQ